MSKLGSTTLLCKSVLQDAKTMTKWRIEGGGSGGGFGVRGVTRGRKLSTPFYDKLHNILHLTEQKENVHGKLGERNCLRIYQNVCGFQ